MPEDKDKAVVKQKELETSKLPTETDELSESDVEKVAGGCSWTCEPTDPTR